jgi:hypothetical protein
MEGSSAHRTSLHCGAARVSPGLAGVAASVVTIEFPRGLWCPKDKTTKQATPSNHHTLRHGPTRTLIAQQRRTTTLLERYLLEQLRRDGFMVAVFRRAMPRNYAFRN